MSNDDGIPSDKSNRRYRLINRMEHTPSRRAFISLVSTGGAAALAGCLEAESEESKIRAVLKKQSDTMEDGDVDGYIETLHPESPLYDETQEPTEQLIEGYDFEIDLEINSIEVDDDAATAEVAQITRIEEPDPDFRSNRAEITHELQTYENEWRIYNSTITDVEYL